MNARIRIIMKKRILRKVLIYSEFIAVEQPKFSLTIMLLIFRDL